MRELVSELHRHPAAERVADDGSPLDVEDGKQVAHPVGVGSDRVIGARLVRLPVAQQVDGDHREPLREPGLNRLPGRGIVTDPVDQQDHRAGAGDAERAPITVQCPKLQLRRDLSHRAKIGLALSHGRQLRCRAREGDQVGSSSSNFLSACCARNRSNSAPSSSPLGRSSSRVSSDRFSCASMKASYCRSSAVTT